MGTCLHPLVIQRWTTCYLKSRVNQFLSKNACMQSFHACGCVPRDARTWKESAGWPHHKTKLAPPPRHSPPVIEGSVRSLLSLRLRANHVLVHELSHNHDQGNQTKQYRAQVYCKRARNTREEHNFSKRYFIFLSDIYSSILKMFRRWGKAVRNSVHVPFLLE